MANRRAYLNLWRAAIGCLALVLVCSAAIAGPGMAERRIAAQTMADWAVETKNADALAEAIALLLDSGGTVEADAPLSVHALIATLELLPGGRDLASAVLAERARGVAIGGGNSRIELALEAGETHRETLVMAAGEPALVEVRLYRGSAGADAELTVRGDDGQVLGSDLGPGTGVEGAMAFVEFTPKTCLAIEIHITNAGKAPARMVVLAPPALGQGCGG